MEDQIEDRPCLTSIRVRDYHLLVMGSGDSKLSGRTNLGRTKGDSLFLVFFAALVIIPALGQGNQPTKALSQREREAVYQKFLKLDQIPAGAIELELKNTIPSEKEIEEKEIFLRNAPRIAIDDRGHIYIPQGYGICEIDELDEEGKLVRKYNKKGQGPGDLLSPEYVFFYNQQVIVHDSQPRRMSFFDRDWKYIKSFSYFKSYYPFALGSNGLFYCSDSSGDKLIYILDLDGKLIGSFGERPYRGRSTLNMLVLGVSPAGSIWVGMQALGKLKRFSSAGRLAGEIDIVEISSKLIKNRLKENLQWAEEGEQKWYGIIREIDFIGEDVLVLDGGGLVQPIFRFDRNGRLKDVYYVKPKMQVHLKSLHVRVEKNGEERFYIWQDHDYDECRIGVYGRKK